MSDLETTQANAVLTESRRWPRGIVPYTIGPALRAHQATILQAMALITSETEGCIHFVPRTQEKDYVEISKAHTCASEVGRSGHRQRIYLTSRCADSQGDVLHELMHTLGFFHEHARKDRDDFVTVNFDNIRNLADVRINFERKYIDTTVLGLPYDYLSIMHYPPVAFARSPFVQTITTKRPFAIGQNFNLSYSDIIRIRKCYNCNVENKEEVFAVGLRYEYDKSQAEDACRAVGAVLATKAQLAKAYAEGASWCYFAWLADALPHFPNNMDVNPRGGCGPIPLLNPIGDAWFTHHAGKFGATCYGIKLRKRQAWNIHIRPFNQFLWSIHDRTVERRCFCNDDYRIDAECCI
ncbi:zinc metalloproteinase nas-14-like [Paramacrobiotus metropolitanus]|uniref:zinc metalloproteinase nas-14-like n=1 Tax=Paramacrobiotus metropolitanus TaxID=2943436 RepID=UPI0024460F57|nr:zinc metalloproteinase nas-14-like [Paramacrobiotus metropolitanus]XP_055330776.1 zinc metalloproteinase nas-14-like [Paramacrobiotus metropolitanus]XP_055330777.1 zinc metalloproteinase nas-14-like [Paramacrobiotus metropolitanus]